MECNYFALDHAVARWAGRTVRYDGPTEALRGKTGRLEVVFDENCCAPTQEQRYLFQGKVATWMKTGRGFERELPHFSCPELEAGL